MALFGEVVSDAVALAVISIVALVVKDWLDTRRAAAVAAAVAEAATVAAAKVVEAAAVTAAKAVEAHISKPPPPV